MHTREASACAAPRALGSTHRWRLLTYGGRQSCGPTLYHEGIHCALKIGLHAACTGTRLRRHQAAAAAGVVEENIEKMLYCIYAIDNSLEKIVTIKRFTYRAVSY
jgi:hypothetical protein